MFEDPAAWVSDGNDTDGNMFRLIEVATIVIIGVISFDNKTNPAKQCLSTIS
jgi:hypothetical protein